MKILGLSYCLGFSLMILIDELSFVLQSGVIDMSNSFGSTWLQVVATCTIEVLLISEISVTPSPRLLHAIMHYM